MAYHLSTEAALAAKTMEHLKGKGVSRVLVLEGPPGVGKTSFAEYLAQRWGAKTLYYLCHHWTGDEDFFLNVHVGRVAAGVKDPQDAYEYGILAKAAIASQECEVVLCLDEIDKAPQRAEALLLDYLQNGRVVLPGQKICANLSNLTVVLTTNGIRPLLEATLRRGFRVKMSFLPPHVEADILRKQTGSPMGAVRAVVRFMNIIRENGATKPSLQEGIRLLQSMETAADAKEVDLLLQGWLCKEPEDMSALRQQAGDPAAILWGEWRR